VLAPSYDPDILVAINRKVYQREKETLPSKTVVVLNSDETENVSETVFAFSFEDIAKQAGGKIASNTVAAGIVLSMLKAPLESISRVLEKMFLKKGDEMLNLNIKAAKLGFEKGKQIKFDKTFDFKRADQETVLMSGSQAAALGAVASDCRFFAFYPMSPATGIFASVSSFADDFPIVVEQAEDEIAAVNMAVGSSFAGVRSLTGTSGGGFCLMSEGLGLAAMTETPLVVIIAQRPGPATGLPTRTAQGDLMFAIHASQDEFPRLVFAPGTVLEVFSTVKKAFHLSEKYQVPAIVLMDQFLCDSIMTEKGGFEFPDERDPASLRSKDREYQEPYLRHAFSEDGISVRMLPCVSKALVRSTGNEHDEEGYISEDAENRRRMVEKRGKKVSLMAKEMDPPTMINPDCEFLLTGWGSSKGSIMEACQNLGDDGIDIGAIVFRDIWPMDSERVASLLKEKKLIMVEQNSTCQLGQLIRQETGIAYHDAVLRYDGRPIYPKFITRRVKQIMER
jgi:2-oxoglutarate ferredoxin oxidoreductase subunit alpha